MSQFYTPFDHFALMPAIILALFGCAILLFDFLLPPDPKQRKLLMLLTVVGLVISGIGLWRQQTFLAASGNDVLNAFNRSEEHTSELQSRLHLVCRLLLEKQKS